MDTHRRRALLIIQEDETASNPSCETVKIKRSCSYQIADKRALRYHFFSRERAFCFLCIDSTIRVINEEPLEIFNTLLSLSLSLFHFIDNNFNEKAVKTRKYGFIYCYYYLQSITFINSYVHSLFFVFALSFSFPLSGLTSR